MKIVTFPHTDIAETPIGYVVIKATQHDIHYLCFFDQVDGIATSPSDLTRSCVDQLNEYFAGKRTAFDLPFYQDGTAFQQQVWEQLMHIPFGKTASYLEMARRLGDEKVIRAAASANGKNKIAIAVPCHRVIGSDGTLTGYAGGLKRKQWLLDHEARVRGSRLTLF